VRRFGDFAVHLEIPRAVLTSRLAALVKAGVLATEPGAHGHDEYALTAKGRDLWPVVRSLLVWGDEHYSEIGPRRVFRHAADDGEVSPAGVCAACGAVVGEADLVVAPGPGLAAIPARTDPVSVALNEPHRLLEPLR
jgi:HxlR-like helix-turn-helix